MYGNDIQQRSVESKSKARDGGDNTHVIEHGFVTSTHEVEAGEEPFVDIEPRGSVTGAEAEVIQAYGGDKGLPAEGTEVLFTRRDDDTALILGVAARDHDGYQYERRISHPHSDAYIEMDEDGNITAENDVGTTVTIEEDIIRVNEGNEPAIADTRVDYAKLSGLEVEGFYPHPDTEVYDDELDEDEYPHKKRKLEEDELEQLREEGEYIEDVWEGHAHEEHPLRWERWEHDYDSYLEYVKAARDDDIEQDEDIYYPPLEEYYEFEDELEEFDVDDDDVIELEDDELLVPIEINFERNFDIWV